MDKNAAGEYATSACNWLFVFALQMFGQRPYLFRFLAKSQQLRKAGKRLVDANGQISCPRIFTEDAFSANFAENEPKLASAAEFSQTGWTHFRPGVPPIREMLGEIWERRELIVVLVLRDLRVRYAQVLLGSLWVVLQPVLTMTILTVVFARIARVEATGDAPYFVWCFAGLLPFQYFSRALLAVSSSLVRNGSLLTKAAFPRLILLLASLIPPLIDFALSLGILVLMMTWFAIPLSIHSAVIVVFLAYAIVLALALGAFLAAASVRYRDVQQLLPFILQGLMLLSPIAYPASLVPAGPLQTLFHLNPLSLIVEGCRWSLLGGSAPDAMQLLSIPCVLLLLGASVWYFRHAERSFADVV